MDDATRRRLLDAGWVEAWDPCFMCGTRYWRLLPPVRPLFTSIPPRPSEEHAGAPTPYDWQDGEQSDNLSTRGRA